jgi:hypothetical protein
MTHDVELDHPSEMAALSCGHTDHRRCQRDTGGVLWRSREGTAYLTYYPAVVLAALYGGIPSGLLATASSAFLCFFWIQKSFMSTIESLAMGVFLAIIVSG